MWKLITVCYALGDIDNGEFYVLMEIYSSNTWLFYINPTLNLTLMPFEEDTIQQIYRFSPRGFSEPVYKYIQLRSDN